ncbi:MAG TPA: ThuA domain-containing protein [Polyangia bacterium]|nr:ThuA domain-containing protein [Polyangia bacterium]
MKTKTRMALVLALALFASVARAAPAKEVPILIVADEVPAMEILANQLGDRVHAKATIVNSKQAPLPESLAGFRAVLVYIHGALAEPFEKALLSYAEGGGNLILLHHSISSGKRPNKNPAWLPALGVTLPEGELAAGGYKYFDDATWDLVDLAPKHPILEGVKFPKTVEYTGGKKLPALELDATEIYLNHVLAGPRTTLLGLRYTEPKSGKLFLQDTAAWVKPLGRGQVSYFMPGHKKTDFDRPDYARMIANAVVYKLK